MLARSKSPASSAAAAGRESTLRPTSTNFPTSVRASASWQSNIRLASDSPGASRLRLSCCTSAASKWWLHPHTEQAGRDAGKARGERPTLCGEACCQPRKPCGGASWARLRHVAQKKPHAEKRGLKLGIENRQALEEFPLEADFEFFFREFDSPNVVYWHDVGHGQIKENLGFLYPVQHPESLASRLAGFHIHDLVFPAGDHAAPGTGTVDFSALKPFAKRATSKFLNSARRCRLKRSNTASPTLK